MARTPYFDISEATPAEREVVERLPPLNVFRMLAHSGGLLSRFAALGNYILSSARLDPHLRELAILRVGMLSGSAYELAQHRLVAREIGVPPEKIEAVGSASDPGGLSELERLVVQFTDEAVRDVAVSRETFDRLLALLSIRELQELLVTVGYYMTVARILETFEVDLEPTMVNGWLPVRGAAGR